MARNQATLPGGLFSAAPSDADFVTAHGKGFNHRVVGLVERDVAGALGDGLASGQHQIGRQSQALSAVCGGQGACSWRCGVERKTQGRRGAADVASGVGLLDDD